MTITIRRSGGKTFVRIDDGSPLGQHCTFDGYGGDLLRQRLIDLGCTKNEIDERFKTLDAQGKLIINKP
jgi:hypothetical protein